MMNLLVLQDHPAARRGRPDNQARQHLLVQNSKMTVSKASSMAPPGANPGVSALGSCAVLPTTLPSVSISTPGEGTGSPVCGSHLWHLPQTTRPDTPRLSDNHGLHQHRKPTVGGTEPARREQTRPCPGIHAEEWNGIRRGKEGEEEEEKKEKEKKKKR